MLQDLQRPGNHTVYGLSSREMGPSYRTYLVQQENRIVPALKTGKLSEVSEFTTQEESTGRKTTGIQRGQGLSVLLLKRDNWY